ncbi:dTDP-4-dehydrorhamnose reductase [Celeribacter marinus]|uniref:dTDP-4-dehydrorhamnose reductase n=1 Tax=Celeribacter marinus TaxID=1397108 RepID=UPI003F6AC267
MILVFGSSGQVASELKSLLPDAMFLGRADVDLSDPERCDAVIRAVAPDAVINAAAYTAVDQAEDDEAAAMAVNGHAPTQMAQTCAALGIAFVHISTDYVFDGAGDTPFAPDHPTAPLGAYGRSKLAGEHGVRDAGGVHVILRTSWVFSPYGANFVKTMLRLSQTRDALSVVADQIGGPTPARAIARACVHIAEALRVDPSKSGTYHFSGAPDVSWAQFARAVFDTARRAVTVNDIATIDYPTPAKRPQNSTLDCTSTVATFGIERPDWRAHLIDLMTELDTPR